MPPIGRFLRNLFNSAIPRKNEAPMYSFHLPENPSAEQVRKVIAIIGHAAGAAIMAEVAKSYGRVMVNGNDETDRMPLTSAALSSASPAAVLAHDAPPPPPPPPPAAVEKDASNMPWDARIHAATKTQNKDGTWKAKKNLDENTKMTVTAELRALYPAPTAAAPPPPPSAAPAPPPPPPAAVAPPPPATTGAADISTFAGVMVKLSGYLAGGKVTKDQSVAACNALGVPNTIALANRADLWPGFCAMLDAYAMGA